MLRLVGVSRVSERPSRRLLRKRSTSDLFAENAAKPLSPRTLTDHEFKVRQFASALVRRGIKIELLAHLKDVLDPERLQIGFLFFLDRAKGQVTKQIIGIACALASVARWGSGMSDPELAAVTRILNKVMRDETGRSRGRRAGMTAKNKALLRQFDDAVNVAKIVYAVDILCEGLPLQGPLTVRQAQAVRTALMIEILLVFPIREGQPRLSSPRPPLPVVAGRTTRFGVDLHPV